MDVSHSRPLTAGTSERILRVEGIVQGVGFRPFVARLAARMDVHGWVRNDRRGVQIRAVAGPAVLDAFAAALAGEAPPAARVVRVVADTGESLADVPVDGGFRILESPVEEESVTVVIPPDLALCADCRRELLDPADRRHGYPFINCTNCGPRYTILRGLPYDRARTSMAEFTLCRECAREYADPANRRFHAEPNACAVCGPRPELWDQAGIVTARDAAAIEGAAKLLRDGGIVAVKGVGGFHLMVDARNDDAVAELRRRKHRDEKPLAVMFPSLEAVREFAAVDAADAAELSSAVAPIVLLRRHATTALAASVAPNNPWVGALLPYAPLHVLLLGAAGVPVVATSGNLSEEPLCIDNAEALARLGGVADGFLMHNREIVQAVDDSVVRPARGGPIVLRRARGLAPTSLPLPADTADGEPLLCVGSHLKNTIALTCGRNVVVSPHIGDLGNAITAAAFRRTVGLLSGMHRRSPARVACDAHPDYASTRFAESLGVPIVRVQHHLAHLLGCLLEYGGGPDRVLGVAWDGTGYGPDGTIWGGEFIVINRTQRIARRVARLRPFRLPGGEAAIREPRRTALGLLEQLDGWGVSTPDLRPELGFASRQLDVLQALLRRGVCAPVTSSAGRLFDGVAALLGLCRQSTFEGQAAMELEAAATGRTCAARERWPVPLVGADADHLMELDWRPLIAGVVAARGLVSADDIAARVHASLAGAIGAVAQQVGLPDVVLSGGCFQNATLLEMATDELEAAGHTVMRHRLLPPNDGGIAAGQALAAAWGLTDVEPGGMGESPVG